jgi:type IV secretory pathway VirB2 component (pilin)
MIATELAAHAMTALQQAPLAEQAPTGLNTTGIVTFFAKNVAPILLAVLGVIFIGRASRGEISKVLTSSAIAIVGLAFIAGAATLFFLGDYLVKLIFS